MPDNTNVNNNSSVTVVGRTAPVPPGQQKLRKSIPVVIASDQAAIPVEEQNKVQSEVALSLLGIPRSEVALGIFADVNTYDVNPTEWTATPEQFNTVENSGIYAGVGQTMGHGLTHVPEESGALLEAPADESAVLTSKRFFRYQPGRVSSATFGVKTTTLNDTGSSIQNPAIRKYGIFDNYDGYYWESRNDGEGDNFSVVRRTQSLIFENPIPFSNTSNPGQTQDYGTTNPYDPLEPRASESTGAGTTSVPTGFTNAELGDLVILRDNLLMTHAGVYDPTLLQQKSTVGITTIENGHTIYSNTLDKTITGADYNINTGLMTITTSGNHGFYKGKFVHLAGIGMTCDVGSFTNTQKVYPNRIHGYNIVRIDSATKFTVNVGVSTVPTFYNSGGRVVGLSTGQYISLEKDADQSAPSNFIESKIYRVEEVTPSSTSVSGMCSIKLEDVTDSTVITNLGNYSSAGDELRLVTPVPFVQPTNPTAIRSGLNAYSSGVKATGMFPYKYTDADGQSEGYIDTTLPSGSTSTLKGQIDDVNAYYKKWVNQNVDIEYLNVYEYRVPRSRFSGDRLDGGTENLLYSDAVADKRAGETVINTDTNEIVTDVSIWDIDLEKVTMYKIEFSWYGAVGALFLAYVPVSNGEARWVRVHHLRASNQLKVSSLGNATLPITYLIYGGGSPNRFGYANSKREASGFSYGTSSEHIVKYGASYYIDGGDRGTVKLFSYGTPTNVDVYGLKRTFASGNAANQVVLTNATNATDPYITGGSSAGLGTSYYVGSKIITSDPLDQNIEVTYVDVANRRLHLNSPLNSTGVSSINVIPNRVTPLVGIKCRDFIQSSTGKDVRNRTQVYPTRLSTGSTAVVKVDLLKSPIFQTTSTTSGSLSLSTDIPIGKRGKPTLLAVTNNTYLSEGTGIYGYFRGKFDGDPSAKPISVLGYLERRGAATGTPGYYFYALDATSDTITLTTTNPFLKEENSSPTGGGVSSATTEFTLAQLSSIKVNPQIRSPIPKTGTIVASLYIPASGEEFDLSPYFDYNKEYLSFPLTNLVDSLYLCASTQSTYNSGTPTAEVSASLTWEEQ